MRIANYNGKSCLDLRDADGKVTPIQLLIVADSGHGKGTSLESIAERWKRSTGGIVILLNDEKKEGEQTFVMYEPVEKYHLRALSRDRIKKSSYKAKLYHPYTHSLAKKGFLPDINFFTLSIKDMTRGDWSILAESDAESETIKLLERVAEDMSRESGMFDFLHEIERLTHGKTDKKTAVPDPKNWFLKSGGGTTKSVKQVGNMLSSFKKDYFLRRDTCPYKINWEKILLDPEPYHIFLTNWITNPKTKNFLVEVLLSQAISEAQRLANIGRLKKPILFLIPEILAVCPAEQKGSSLYLAKALRKSLITMRSQAGGMSCIADTQIWSQTSPEVRAAFNNTFYGKLNPEDSSKIAKANSYTTKERQTLNAAAETKGSFVWYKNEEYGVFNIFMPSHSHKEVGANKNWIQVYKKNFKDRMKRYDNLVNEMKFEFNEEEKKVRKIIEKKQKDIDDAEVRREAEKQAEKSSGDSESKPKKVMQSKAKQYLYKRAWELHGDGFSDRKIAEEIGLGSHKTAKKYYLKYQEELDVGDADVLDNNVDEGTDENVDAGDEGDAVSSEAGSPEDVKSNLGEGVMPEEVEAQFDSDTPTPKK